MSQRWLERCSLMGEIKGASRSCTRSISSTSKSGQGSRHVPWVTGLGVGGGVRPRGSTGSSLVDHGLAARGGVLAGKSSGTRRYVPRCCAARGSGAAAGPRVCQAGPQ